MTYTYDSCVGAGNAQVPITFTISGINVGTIGVSGSISGAFACFVSGICADATISGIRGFFSGLTNDGILSGTRATFQSGVDTQTFSGNIADFSGIVVDITSGLRATFSSGVITVAISGLLSIQMSGAVSGRVATSDTSGNLSWQPVPAGSVPDPLDNSGAMIDILSGIRATFNSGVEVPSISGNLARFSGITSEVVSGNRGAFNSGIITSAISGLLGFQMSGAISGRIITSDLNGVGTWQPPPAGGGGGGGGISGTAAILQAHVFLSVTMTNIGTPYKTIYTTAFNPERGFVLETSGYNQFRILFQWDYVGTGSQQLRWVDSGVATNVLWESPTFLVDSDPGDSGWVNISGNFVNIQKKIRWDGKSTIAADDPIAKGYSIYLRYFF